jgi:hypothetical protein
MKMNGRNKMKTNKDQQTAWCKGVSSVPLQINSRAETKEMQEINILTK